MEEKQKETVEKIGSIKEHLAHTDTEQLMEFVQAYESDSRAGVQKLVETARKRFDKLQQEKIRTESLKKYEKEYDNYTYICGIDEVGRGPLAGPVVAAAVILPKDAIFYISMILRSFRQQNVKNCMMLSWKKRCRSESEWLDRSGSMRSISCRQRMRQCVRQSDS